MQLFKTEMLRFHPPQLRTSNAGLCARRPRFGCRTAPRLPSTQALAVAVRSALVSPFSEFTPTAVPAAFEPAMTEYDMAAEAA